MRLMAIKFKVFDNDTTIEDLSEVRPSCSGCTKPGVSGINN